jgi:glycosyltransferase involved in cell wall biosynthesis
MPGSSTAWLESRRVAPNIEVLTAHTTAPFAGFHDGQIAELQRLLGARLSQQPIDVCWLYTPMALPLVDDLDVGCLVYDCMDELSAFKDAPRQLRQRESALMRRADVVLAGGPSLFESRRLRHPNVYCVPSSVEPEHYSPARLRDDPAGAQAAQALQGHIAGPRLGFFGVIDERMDLQLVERLARARPQWQLVMVGPVVKIDRDALPSSPNIHWLGMQPYALLPHLLAGWDVALMPFALNEATRFISPTKTLEYLAGEKPVVSTPIADVIGLYGHAVEIARSADEFGAACERVLAEDARAAEKRLHTTLATVATQSWEHSAQSVATLLQAATARHRAAAMQAPLSSTPAAVPRLAVAGGG